MYIRQNHDDTDHLGALKQDGDYGTSAAGQLQPLIRGGLLFAGL